MTINIDYLILNLNLPNAYEVFQTRFFGTDFQINELEYGTKVFGKAAELLYRKEKIASIMYEIRGFQETKNPYLMQVQFTNKFLWDALQYQKSVLYEFLTITGAVFHSINRMDIAIDGNRCDFLDDIFKIEIQDEKYVRAGKAESRIFTEHIEGRKHLVGFAVGKRGQDRFFRMYSKYLESRNNPKKWQIETWKNSGINPVEVLRFECELRQKYLKGIKDVFEIYNRKFLFKVFETAQKNFCEYALNKRKEGTVVGNLIREKVKGSRFDRLVKVSLFDREKLVKQIEYSKDCEDFQKHIPSDGIERKTLHWKKGVIRSNFLLYLRSNQSNYLNLFLISQIFSDSKLDGFDYKNYLLEKCGYWFNQYQKINENYSLTFDKNQFLEDLNSILTVEV